jgi:hypothetical protein
MFDARSRRGYTDAAEVPFFSPSCQRSIYRQPGSFLLRKQQTTELDSSFKCEALVGIACIFHEVAIRLKIHCLNGDARFAVIEV